MIKKKGFLIIFIVFITLIYSVYAQSTFKDFTTSISDVFENIHKLFAKTYVVWGTILILAYLLFYGTLTSAAKRVRIFEGEGGEGVNSSGKLVCHAITGLIVLFFVRLELSMGISNFISKTLLSFGFIGVLILNVVVFLLIYKTARPD